MFVSNLSQITVSSYPQISLFEFIFHSYLGCKWLQHFFHKNIQEISLLMDPAKLDLPKGFS